MECKWKCKLQIMRENSTARKSLMLKAALKTKMRQKWKLHKTGHLKVLIEKNESGQIFFTKIDFIFIIFLRRIGKRRNGKGRGGGGEIGKERERTEIKDGKRRQVWEPMSRDHYHFKSTATDNVSKRLYFKQHFCSPLNQSLTFGNTGMKYYC